MGFQRAQWHSGLTYQQTCQTCKTVLQYTDYSLDFRPWYADGYVDCPKCKSHLRHNENYAIGRTDPAPRAQEAPVPEKPAYMVDLKDQAPTTTAAKPAFCGQCGNKFSATDRFCPQCGAKRP